MSTQQSPKGGSVDAPRPSASRGLAATRTPLAALDASGSEQLDDLHVLLNEDRTHSTQEQNVAEKQGASVNRSGTYLSIHGQASPVLHGNSDISQQLAPSRSASSVPKLSARSIGKNNSLSDVSNAFLPFNHESISYAKDSTLKELPRSGSTKYRHLLRRIYSSAIWFLAHSRTERALRTTAFLLPALLCTYYKWIDTNFAYSCSLLYLLMAALLPPMICGVSMVGTMAFPAGVFGVAFVSGVWAVGLTDAAWSPELRMYLMFAILIVLVCPWKIGKTSGITAMGALMTVYVSQLVFFSGFTFITSGGRVILSRTIIEDFVQFNSNVLSTVIQELPPPLQAIARTILETISSGGPLPSISPFNVTIPEFITRWEPDYEPLVGVNVTVSVTEKGIVGIVPPALWFIRVAWTATGKLGLVRAILMYGGFALACYVVSLLVPPQRYIRSFLRQRVSHLVREEAIIVQMMFETSHLMTTRMYHSLGISAKLPLEHHIPKINNRTEQPHQTDIVKHDNSFTSASIQSVTAFPQTANQSCLYPSPEEAEEVTRQTMDYEFNASTAIAERDSQPSSVKQRSPTVIHETLRQTIVGMYELTAMTVAAALEPSLSNPGPLIWYAFQWSPTITTLRSVLVHSSGFWDICRMNPRVIFNLQKTAETDVEIHLSSVQYLVKHTSIFERIVISAIELYRLNAVLIGLHPVSRGAQMDSFRHLRMTMQQRITKHTYLAKQFLHDNNINSMLTSSESMTEPWTNALLKFGAMLEFYSMILHGPIELSSHTDQFIAASTEKKCINPFLNALAFFIPLFSLFLSFLKTLARFLTPWSWGWRMPRSATGVSCYFTNVAWYRSTDVAFCLRWVVGLMIVLAPPIFWKSYRNWIVSDSTSPSLFHKVLIDPLTSKVASWSTLAFLTTIFMTVEGTIHRAGLRIIGVLLGSASGYVCLTIFGTDNRTAHIVWIMLTTFLACWIGGNPTSALLGYHPSWGYAFQLFTYQQAIIVVEAYSHVQTKRELVATRLVAHVIGIGLACIISLLLFPNQANVSVQLASVQVLYCNTQSVLAVAESRLAMLTPFTNEAPVPSISDPLIGDDIDAENENEEEPNNDNPGESHPTSASSWKRFQQWLRVRCACTRRSNKTKVSRVTKTERDGSHESRKLVRMLNKRARMYKHLSDDGIQAIQAHVKDSLVFRELPVHTLEPRWFHSTRAIQLLSLRQDALMDTMLQSNTYCSFAHNEFYEILRAIRQLSLTLEEVIGNRRRTSWFAGYDRNLWFGFLVCCPCVKRRRTLSSETSTLELQNRVDPVRKSLERSWDALGKTFPDVILKLQACDSQLSSKSQDGPMSLFECSGLPPEVWEWLSLAYFLLKYSQDLLNYTALMMSDNFAV